MSKKDEKILELSYTIEVLEGEIEHLEEVIADTKAKLWEVICDNDRLTLAFEPYIPPGHEDAELTFYGLKEENDMLTQKVLDKMEIIEELDEEVLNQQRLIASLRKEIYDVGQHYTNKAPQIPVKPKRVKNERWWNFSVELWPGAWGLNYYRYDWQRAQRNGHPGTSREGNFQIGPFGFSWNREPKR